MSEKLVPTSLFLAEVLCVHKVLMDVRGERRHHPSPLHSETSPSRRESNSKHDPGEIYVYEVCMEMYALGTT